MKIAVCISGQPRFYQHGYKYLHELFTKYPMYTFDIFIHCWFSESDIGTRYPHSYYRDINESELVIQPNTDKFIRELYCPKMIVFEPIRQFDTSDICDSLIDETTTARQRSNYNNVMSNMYSKYMTNQLLVTYMNTHQQTYDLVIGTRFDYLNHFVIDLPNVDTTKLNIIDTTRFNINDSYIVTNPQLYSDYVQTYPNLEYFINDISIKQSCLKICKKFEFVPEDILMCNLLYLHGENILSHIEMRKDMLQFFR